MRGLIAIFFLLVVGVLMLAPHIPGVGERIAAHYEARTVETRAAVEAAEQRVAALEAELSAVADVDGQVAHWRQSELQRIQSGQIMMRGLLVIGIVLVLGVWYFALRAAVRHVNRRRARYQSAYQQARARYDEALQVNQAWQREVNRYPSQQPPQRPFRGSQRYAR